LTSGLFRIEINDPSKKSDAFTAEIAEGAEKSFNASVIVSALSASSG